MEEDEAEGDREEDAEVEAEDCWRSGVVWEGGMVLAGGCIVPPLRTVVVEKVGPPAAGVIDDEDEEAVEGVAAMGRLVCFLHFFWSNSFFSFNIRLSFLASFLLWNLASSLSASSARFCSLASSDNASSSSSKSPDCMAIMAEKCSAGFGVEDVSAWAEGDAGRGLGMKADVWERRTVGSG